MNKNASGDAKETKKRFRLTGLGMAKILLISAIISLVINAAYLAVEIICANSGNDVPIYREIYGGDCIEYVGIYCYKTILTPATSSEDAAPAMPMPRYSFVPMRFLCAFAVLFVIFWLILSLINKYFKQLLILFGSVAGIALIFYGGKALIKKYNDEPQKLISVTVITPDLHPGVCSGVYYPFYYAHLTAPGESGKYGCLQGDDLSTVQPDLVKPEDVSKAQLKELLRAAQELEKNRSLNVQAGFRYRIRIEYESRSKTRKLVIIGYESFPEEYAAFIRVLNETCGMDLLREQPEAVSYSFEWFSDTFGIYDSDLPEGATVEGYLMSQRIGLDQVCGHSASGKLTSFDPTDSLEHYLQQFSEAGQ